MSTKPNLPDRRELAQNYDLVDSEDNEALAQLLERESEAAREAAEAIVTALRSDERIDVDDMSTLSEASDALNALWHHLCVRDEFQ
jgi:hypothetical protein